MATKATANNKGAFLAIGSLALLTFVNKSTVVATETEAATTTALHFSTAGAEGMLAPSTDPNVLATNDLGTADRFARLFRHHALCAHGHLATIECTDLTAITAKVCRTRRAPSHLGTLLAKGSFTCLTSASMLNADVLVAFVTRLLWCLAFDAHGFLTAVKEVYLSAATAIVLLTALTVSDFDTIGTKLLQAAFTLAYGIATKVGQAMVTLLGCFAFSAKKAIAAA
jgi:hypothetical protein